MRLSVLVMFIVLSCSGVLSAARSSGQDLSKVMITLGVKDKSLERALKDIEQATSFRFAYKASLLKPYASVNLPKGWRSVEETLKLLLAATQLGFEQQQHYIFIKAIPQPGAAAPPVAELRITGTVKDQLGKELIGVTVRNIATGKGTVTNENGFYTIGAEQGHVLEFSYIGYNPQQVTISERIVHNITMEARAGSLNDLVVVGFGHQKKVTTIGAQTSIRAEELKQPVANLSNVIAGRVAGMIGVQRSGEPGYDNAEVWIRGISTFTNSSPLVLVDGVERAFNNIDPEDIASFSILKDASATAVYGVRGANGVILITLKKGKAGKPSINFQYNQGVTAFTRVPDFADGVTYMHMANEAYKNSNPNAVNPLYSQEAIQKTADGSDPDLYPNVDWYKEMFNKTGQNKRANLNVNGGSDNAQYYISLSYFDEKGLYKVDELSKYNYAVKYSRFNFTSNLNLRITKSTKLDFGASGYITNGNYPGNSASDIWGLATLVPPIVHPPKYSNGLFAQQRSGDLWNPYTQLTQSGYSTEVRSQLWSNVRVTQELDFITKGLSATTMFSFDNYNNHEINRRKTVDGYIATGRDADGKLMLDQTRVGQAYLGYNRANGGDRRIYTESAINYARTYGKHDVGGMVLFNQSDYVNAFAGDFMSSIPNRYRGLAGRLTYGYDSRYLAEANFGYNGSETFAPDKRYGFFPSFGLGWVLTNEKFFTDFTKAVSFLKLRFSSGLVGNSSINGRRFAYISTVDGGNGGYTFGKSMNNRFDGYDIGDYAVEVSWEKAHKSNLGVDLKLLDNSISLTADVFREVRTGIFLQRGDITQYMGIRNLPWGNLGEIHNKGLDATLEYNKRIGAVDVGFRGNFTWNRATVIDDARAPLPYPWQQTKGRKLGQRFGLIALGLFKDDKEIANSPYQTGINKPGDIRYKDLNADGMINDKDKGPIGNGSIPEIVYGFGPTLGWKGFSLGAFFKGISKVDIYLNGSGLQPFSHGSTRGNLFTEISNRWTPENPDPRPFYPRLTYGTENMNYETSSYWVKNGAFLRLQNLEFSYTFQKPDWFRRVGLANMRLYFLGYNLATFSKFKMWDVELGDGKGAMYPLIKTYNIGIDCRFR
ncbi:SusC/RagA family TonB-linked outer membrane protein [Chitinophaga sp. NPDC101104]|uniref:SusC/RagA family TonB-linked outer membrane protein n=1 Tax=Chitinophaga sp. NPDC101104 TaxID=3390561 RepID=UPI003D025C89